MSAFQGEVYAGRIRPIVRTLVSVRIIEVSVFRGVCKAGFHCIGIKAEWLQIMKKALKL